MPANDRQVHASMVREGRTGLGDDAVEDAGLKLPFETACGGSIGDVRLEDPARGEHRIPDRFRLETSLGHSPQCDLVGIRFSLGPAPCGGHAVGPGQDDLPDHRLGGPLEVDESGGEMIEKRGVRRLFAAQAEVVGCGHHAAPEEV